MSDSEKALELLKATLAFEKHLKGMIREEWNIELMKDALGLLNKSYQRLKEKYENPVHGYYNFHMIDELSNKLDVIHYLRWKLDDPLAPMFLSKLKEELVWTIVDYYHDIAKYIEENEGVKA